MKHIMRGCGDSFRKTGSASEENSGGYKKLKQKVNISSKSVINSQVVPLDNIPVMVFVLWFQFIFFR